MPLNVSDIYKKVLNNSIPVEFCVECNYSRDGIKQNGYPIVYDPKSRKMFKAHRIAWMNFKGAIPKDMCICHICDNRKCINIDHLFLGTKADNNKDKGIKRRSKHKLSKEDVQKIRTEYILGKGQIELATKWGINQSNISRIINYKRNQYVTND